MSRLPALRVVHQEESRLGGLHIGPAHGTPQAFEAAAARIVYAAGRDEVQSLSSIQSAFS
jgi:hypothetical protein